MHHGTKKIACVVDPDALTDVVAGDLLLGRQPGQTEKTKAHQHRTNKQNDGHAEVTDAALQAEAVPARRLGKK